MCCAVAALVGCASTARQMSESSLDEKNLERAELQSSTGLSQPLILDERAFRQPDLDTNGAVTLDEWRHFDTQAAEKETFSTLDEKDNGQINVAEFLNQAPKHSKLYSVFGDAEQNDNRQSTWNQQEFRPQGLQLFSIRF